MTNITEKDLPKTIEALDEFNQTITKVAKALEAKDAALKNSLLKVNDMIDKINKAL